MPKSIVFQHNNHEFSFHIDRVDRSKLYGFKDVDVFDEEKRPCELATLADDGRTVVGRGGTGIGYLSPDGEWVEKAALTAVNAEGQAMEPVPSSFDAPIELSRCVDVEEFLEHRVRTVYLLTPEESVDPSSIVSEVSQGKIFHFPFSYRGGLGADAGFIVIGEDNSLFMIVGDPINIEFVGLDQTVAAADDREEDEEEDSDIMDFNMI